MSLISDAPVHPATAGGSWAEVAKLVEERDVVCSDANDDLGEESERTNEGGRGTSFAFSMIGRPLHLTLSPSISLRHMAEQVDRP